MHHLPHLVAVWPEMRRHMYRRWFLSRQSASFDVLLLGVMLAPVAGWPAAALALPYMAVRAVERGRFSNPVKVAARVVLGLPRSCITFAALVYGSVRHRTPLF